MKPLDRASYEIKTFEAFELALSRRFSPQELEHIRRNLRYDSLMDCIVLDMTARFVRGEVEYKHATYDVTDVETEILCTTLDYFKAWLVRVFPWLTAPAFQPKWHKHVHRVRTTTNRYYYNVVPAYSESERYAVLTQPGTDVYDKDTDWRY